MVMYELEELTTERIKLNERGLKHLKELFENEADLAFDLDDTLKFPRNFPSAPETRFDAGLPAELKRLNDSGHRTGILTEQSALEIGPFLSSMLDTEVTDVNQLFSGYWLTEGGHAVKPKDKILYPGQMKIGNLFEDKAMAKKADLIVLTKPEALKQMTDLKAKIRNLWQKDGTMEKWGYIPKLSTPIFIPEDNDPGQGIGTVSIHERGSFIGSPDYSLGTYEQVFTWVEELIIHNGFEHLDLYEAGNGTLRVVQKGMDKAKALKIWALAGTVDLNRLIYFCDGPNDLRAAKLIKIYGGGIVSPNNAIPEIQEIADYVSPFLVSTGVVDLIRKLI